MAQRYNYSFITMSFLASTFTYQLQQQHISIKFFLCSPQLQSQRALQHPHYGNNEYMKQPFQPFLSQ